MNSVIGGPKFCVKCELRIKINHPFFLADPGGVFCILCAKQDRYVDASQGFVILRPGVWYSPMEDLDDR